MAYNTFQSNKPDPAVDGGTAFGNNTNRNDVALRDAIVMGQMQGFAFSKTDGSGSAAQPQYFLWTNGSTILRATNTWQSGGVTDGNITQQVWELSTNGGTNYDAICTEVFSFDGSGNATTTTNAGGMLSWLLSKLAPLKKVIADLATHAGLTGSSAHGLGTISTQASNNVSLTGGTVNGVTIGGSTPAAGTFTRANEQYNTYTPTSNAGVTVDWSKGGSSITTNGTNTLSFSNVPSGVIATHTLFVDKANGVNYPAAVNWGSGGRPSLGAVAGIIQLVTTDGGTNVRASYYWNA